MSDYLGNLIARTIAPTICVRPRVPSIFEPHPPNTGKFELNFEQERFRDEKSLPRFESEARSASDQSNIHRTVTEEKEIIQREIIRPKKIVAEQAEGTGADDTTVPTRISSRTGPDSSMPSPVGTVAQSSSTPRDPPVATSRRPTSNAVKVDVPWIRHKTRPLSDRAVGESPRPRLSVVPPQSIASTLPHLKPQRLPGVRAVVPSARSVLGKPASTKHEPTISVTIGRVEIRAVSSPAPQRAKPKPTTVLSLEDYLRQRAAGGSR